MQFHTKDICIKAILYLPVRRWFSVEYTRIWREVMLLMENRVATVIQINLNRIMHLPRKHTSYFQMIQEGNQLLQILQEQTDRKATTEMNYLMGIFQSKLKKRTKQSKRYLQLLLLHRIQSQREAREIGNQLAINLIRSIQILSNQEVQVNHSLFSLKLHLIEETPRLSSKHNRQCSAPKNKQAKNWKQPNLACTVRNTKNTKNSKRN